MTLSLGGQFSESDISAYPTAPLAISSRQSPVSGRARSNAGAVRKRPWEGLAHVAAIRAQDYSLAVGS